MTLTVRAVVREVGHTVRLDLPAATPRLTDDGWARTIELLDTIAAETVAAGARIALSLLAAALRLRAAGLRI